MPALVVDNTVQIRLIWALNTVDTAVNVYHGIKKDVFSSVDQAAVDDLKNQIVTQFNASTFKTAINQNWSLARVGIRDLNTANQPEFISGVTGAAGTFTSELLPLNVALCVTLRTGKAGTSYRGRTYLGGWTEGGSTGGVAAANQVTAATDWVTRLQSAFSTAGYDLAVASRKLGKSEKVTSIQTRNNVWDTQRRRIVPGI